MSFLLLLLYSEAMLTNDMKCFRLTLNDRQPLLFPGADPG